MMPNLTRYLPALFAIALINVSVVGCAQKGLMQKESQLNPQSEVCRNCHVSNMAAGAKDFSAIYSNLRSHHPIGVKYPIGSSDNQNFKLPNRQTTDVAYFDRNGNGQPDSDEIQLFGLNGEVTVECATCHIEHGSSRVSSPAGFYLRVANVGSAVCITCHRQ